jgi:thymidylate synthase (FAD)
MTVALLRYTPNPEHTVAAAARLCYSDVSASQLDEKMSDAQVKRLLSHVIASGHHSTLEHVSFSFAVDGLSRASSHQLVRHRLASYSQQSQRWVAFSQASYVTPPSVSADPQLRRDFEEAVDAAFAAYRRLLEAGVPAEDARYLLPNATTTRLVMTMNARELIHVCSVRLCRRAQWEIRALFEDVKVEVAKVAPIFADYLQPKCVPLGYCDEERESCGFRPPRREVLGER